MVMATVVNNFPLKPSDDKMRPSKSGLEISVEDVFLG